MFSLPILETICAATSVAVAFMACLCCNEIFGQIDKSFTKLKTERKMLETKIRVLEEENEYLKNNATITNNTNASNKKTTGLSSGIIAPEEINRVLVEENKKLHVRCDMLEEELLKIREKSSTTDKQVKFRQLTGY